MRHDWIFDVLTDLRSYALGNDLPDLAAEVDQVLRVARREIGAPGDDGLLDAVGKDGVPPVERPN